MKKKPKQYVLAEGKMDLWMSHVRILGTERPFVELPMLFSIRQRGQLNGKHGQLIFVPSGRKA